MAMEPIRGLSRKGSTMISKSWHRVLLSSLAAALLLLPVASQAAPRASRVAVAVDRIAEPAQWLTRLWEAVSGLWQTVTASDQTNATGQGDPGETPTNDGGITIDPDGKPGG